MTWPLRLDADRFFPADPATRSLSRRLFAEVERVPILSPHGHCDPAWFALDQPFEDAVSLLLWPDHYILRLLFSQGVSLECLGLRPHDNAPLKPTGAPSGDARRPLPAVSRHALTLWLDHVFAEVFGIEVRLEPETAIIISTPSVPLSRMRHSGLARSSSASASSSGDHRSGT